jgi:uncharacterized membrane protein
MEPILNYIQKMQLHPQVDHFTVALLLVAVFIDLVAGPRLWLRYTALLLMILGALAAGGSYLTGGMEAERIWKALGPPAQAILKRHGQIGLYLAIAFGILAIWRIMIQAFLFMAGSRFIYLIVAILAAVILGYQSHLGGVLVYDYGAGTALMGAAPVPNEAGNPAATPATLPTTVGPLPTVSVPTGLPTPTASPTPSGSSSPEETARPTDAPTSVPTGSPTAGAM